MGSFQDFQTGMICSDHGWWNPNKRSDLFPPFATPLSDFTWTSSTLTSMDNQSDQIQQQQLVDASYSRSDDSDDHQSSSVEVHLPVMNSDYVQTFQDVQKPQLDDFGVSDWLHNSLWNDPAFSQDFFNQFDTTNEASRMTLQSSYPEELQNQVEPGSVTNYIFDNNFVASGGTTPDHWPRSLSSKINHGSNPSNDKNHMAPFWDSWMGSDQEIGAPESHQLLVPAFFEDQKPYKKDTSYKLQYDTTTLTKRKITNDEVYKRPRIETPSSLPTFKVRKEKLGDRITALQQLVSPFGKTDTASVLHEAVEYIKFLHDQVLRTPYIQNGTTTNQHQQMQGESEDTKEGLNKDLRSRGLCLVPISSTFPVANETTSGFWTPSFGGTMPFR